MIIECLLAEEGQTATIEEQQTKVKKHVDDIITLITSKIRVCDIIALQEQYKERGQYVRATVLLRCVSAICEQGERLERIIEGVGQMIGIVREGLDSSEKKDNIQKMGSRFFLPSMYELLEEYRRVAGGNETQRTKGEAECLLAIGYCHILLNEWQNGIDRCREGIGLIRGSNVHEVHILTGLWYIQGTGFHNQGNYTEAESCYEYAIESATTSKQFPNDAERNKCIIDISKDLETVRGMKKLATE